MKLSQYFSLGEMTASQTALRKGIDNIPKGQALVNLKGTASRMDSVRILLGNPIYISSGFRSPILNNAIGGSRTSSHVSGLAVDFTCPAFGVPRDVFNAIKNSAIKFDQLILEFPDSPSGWVHIGFGSMNRGQCLVTTDGKTYKEI